MSVKPHKLLTYEDYVNFPDDRIRREIIGGEICVIPSSTIRHQDMIGRAILEFANHIRAHGGGRVMLGPVDVLLSEHDIVMPDIAFVTDDRRDIVKENYILGTPSLMIEVLSDARTDRVRKRDLYARAGVPEYWIVDPDADRVEIYRLQEGVYAKPEVCEPGETLTTALLPGLSIDISALFAPY